MGWQVETFCITIVYYQPSHRLGRRDNKWFGYFSDIYKASCINKLRVFQFRLLYRVIPTNKSLFTWKMINSNLCTFCNQTEETLMHLLWYCQTSNLIWSNLFNWFRTRTGINIYLSVSNILLGLGKESTINVTLNMLSTNSKQFIYACRCLGENPVFDKLLSRIYYYKKLERAIALKKATIHIHNKKWELLLWGSFVYYIYYL